MLRHPEKPSQKAIFRQSARSDIPYSRAAKHAKSRKIKRSRASQRDLPATSIVPQGDRRVDAHGSPRGNLAGEQRDED